MKDLKEVLVNKNKIIVWTTEEDDILEQCRNKPDSSEYKLLVRLKTLERVERRI